jgi:hypothetical protein
MDKTYRVILINPEDRSIRELQASATLDNIHELVGAEVLGHFGVALFEDTGQMDTGWVDDGGLSRGEPVQAFLFPRTKDPIAGRCLIVGADRHGVTCDCRMPIEILRQDVTWLGKIVPEVTWDHTEQGSQAIVTYSRVT